MSRRIAIIAGVVLAVAVPVWSQTQITTGVIQGTVSDQSGALVPGAVADARNLDTNSTRKQTTLADGRFVFLCGRARMWGGARILPERLIRGVPS